MPEIVRPDGARIHYAVHGTGFPVLLLAPGGVSSQLESWESAIYHPVRELSDRYTVIAMDQRHAGRSPAPVAPFSYDQLAADQLAVLDALRVDRAHVLGAEIGATYAWRLAAEAPERVQSLVCQEPPGRDTTNTLGTFFRQFDESMRLVRAEGFDGVFAAAARDGRFATNPGAGPFAQRLHDDPGFRAEIRALGRERYIGRIVQFRDGMYPDGMPYFSVGAEWLGRLPVATLLIPGSDPLHPEGVAKRLVTQIPKARLLDLGIEARQQPRTVVDAVTGFLADHTPQ